MQSTRLKHHNYRGGVSPYISWGDCCSPSSLFAGCSRVDSLLFFRLRTYSSLGRLSDCLSFFAFFLLLSLIFRFGAVAAVTVLFPLLAVAAEFSFFRQHKFVERSLRRGIQHTPLPMHLGTHSHLCRVAAKAAGTPRRPTCWARVGLRSRFWRRRGCRRG